MVRVEEAPLPGDHLTAAEVERLLGRIDDLQSRVVDLTRSVESSSQLATLGLAAAMMAHEFNNLLTPIQSYAELALARPEDRLLATKALERAAAGARQLAGISHSILALSGDPRYRSERSAGGAAVGEAVDEALLAMSRDPARDGIRVVRELPTEAGDLVVAMEPVALQQVLVNLMLNARKAMLPGGGELTIAARRLDSEGGCSTWNIGEGVGSGQVGSRGGEATGSPGSEDGVEDAVGRAEGFGPAGSPGGGANGGRGSWVVVEVRDTGRGMAPEELRRIFRPFVSGSARGQQSLVSGIPLWIGNGPETTSQAAGKQRLTNNEQAANGGIGLGLTICQGLVEAVGGRIEVESAVGAGSRFVLTLPGA